MDPFQHYRHLRRTKRYVKEHLTEPIALADIARDAGLSPAHYSAFFHRVTGVWFNVWLRRQRIDRAKKLLRESDHPIYRIAIDAGLGSLSAFERSFKAFTLMPPSTFRKISRNRMLKGFAQHSEKIAEHSII